MKIPLAQDQAIAARMALIVGADNFDRLFRGVQFDEFDGTVLYVYAADEYRAAEIEDTFRECLVLRDVEELSYEEIGEITGLPPGTVKSRIFRARAQLKELVEKRLGEKIG